MATSDLTAALAADLGAMLGRAVEVAHLQGRHDGAAAPVLGMIGASAPARHRVVARLLAEWVAAGTATEGEAPEVWGIDDHRILTLEAEGEVLLRGMCWRPVPIDLSPAEALERLLPGIATLAGATPEVVVVGEGRAEPVPGWIARLGLLAGLDHLGPTRAATDDPGGWLVAAHSLAASIYVPGADEHSIWSGLQARAQDLAVSALDNLGERGDGDGELDRRGSADFKAQVDMEVSATLVDHPTRSGNVLQIVRLPRVRGGQLHKAAVLLAPGT